MYLKTSKNCSPLSASLKPLLRLREARGGENLLVSIRELRDSLWCRCLDICHFVCVQEVAGRQHDTAFTT